MNKSALISGSLLGMLGVMIGAFGAHALNDLLIAHGRLDVFETGVRYQFYHALVLLVVGAIADKIDSFWATKSVYCFVSGVIIFSGSLYILSLSNLGVWGMITPIGGVLMIAGWVSLIAAIIKARQ